MLQHDKAGSLTDQVSTAHSLNGVPLLVWGAPPGARLANTGSLANIAATALDLMGLEAPADYQPSLILTE